MLCSSILLVVVERYSPLMRQKPVPILHEPGRVPLLFHHNSTDQPLASPSILASWSPTSTVVNHHRPRRKRRCNAVEGRLSPSLKFRVRSSRRQEKPR